MVEGSGRPHDAQRRTVRRQCRDWHAREQYRASRRLAVNAAPHSAQTAATRPPRPRGVDVAAQSRGGHARRLLLLMAW